MAGNSLVGVYRKGKLVRYEDDEGNTVAIVSGGKLKATSHGLTKGYYVMNGVLRKEGQDVYLGKPFVKNFGR